MTPTDRIRRFALRELNVDLIGFANIERFANAPVKMSPQGILPSARSVIVMALHHGDAAIEMGGRTHPQDIGPYAIQYHMNMRLDETSFRMARFLESIGHDAVPIVSSNIWRFKGYKDLTEIFAPDVSHMHAAVAAGLAEFGYNGLAITPEYGARQRYVTVITDAVLEPTPLVEPGSVCDQCMLCKKHCRSGALSKELDGFNVVEIEDKTYTYVRKNLWRCSWGEHYDLDLDLPIPEHVDENTITEAIAKHGLRGGEMGSCLRYCVPKARRFFQRDYTDAPRRRKDATPEDLPLHRGRLERVRAAGLARGADFVDFLDADTLAKTGQPLADFLPDAVGAVVVGIVVPPDPEAPPSEEQHGINRTLNHTIEYLGIQSAYDVMREFERMGYTALPLSGIDEDAVRRVMGITDPAVRTQTVLTNADLPLQRTTEPEEEIREILPDNVDAAGIASADLLRDIAKQLRPHFERDVLVARDVAGKGDDPEPVVEVVHRRILTPDDVLDGAKSVIVLGLRMPRATVETTARTPAEAIGPYSFAQFETIRLLCYSAFQTMTRLRRLGYRAAWSLDLLNTGGTLGTSRGDQPDTFCNRFAAVAAGLGRLSECGTVVNPDGTSRMRYLAIVTDAPLPTNEPITDDLATACADCSRCTSACTTAAFGDSVSVQVGPIAETFRPTDPQRCDWAKRYSLVAEEGNALMGWDLDLPYPETMTADTLADAIRQHPTYAKHRPCNMELCTMACPYVRTQ